MKVVNENKMKNLPAKPMKPPFLCGNFVGYFMLAISLTFRKSIPHTVAGMQVPVCIAARSLLPPRSR